MIFYKFLPKDAKEIFFIPLSQREVHDKVVWAASSTGMYSAKEGYRYWCNQQVRSSIAVQSPGWKRLWSLFIPLKISIFIWRFCRNTVQVRLRLSSKGIRLPIICPMCSLDIEHLLHVFFDCQFAHQCWNNVGLVFDMSRVEEAPVWLLSMLSTVNDEEITNSALCSGTSGFSEINLYGREKLLQQLWL